jgi:tetratricopeptide (TPR) repeat protein
VTHSRTAAKARPVAQAPAATTSSASTTATTNTTTPSAPASPEQLQLTGHNELLAGQYAQAIPTLRKAVSAADPSNLSYAYALYDLGKALLESGNAAAAIPVLEQRAKIPNQTPVVLTTLNQALRAAGQPTVPVPGQPDQPSTPAAPGTGAHGHGHGSGGAGLPASGQGRHQAGEHKNLIT